VKTIGKIFLGIITAGIVLVLVINVIVFFPLLSGKVDVPPFPSGEIRAAAERQKQQEEVPNTCP
jgi:hypothetical protein